MRVVDWQILDPEIILHLACTCGAEWTAEESDLHFDCPECGKRRKIKPHPKTCLQCDNRYTLRGCPHWITEADGFQETNTATNEKRIVTGCSKRVMVRMMQHVVMASNRPAESVESTRNEIVKGFSEVTQAMHRMPEIVQQRLSDESQR